MLLAGRDTVSHYYSGSYVWCLIPSQTASVISYVIYFLASHADITRKLRGEIIQAYGTNGQPSIEDMKDLKYCMFHFIHNPVPCLTTSCYNKYGQ